MLRLIDTDLKKTISYHVNLYKKSFERRLGMDEDDVMNDVMEQIYKGLLTYDATKKANKKTYLNSLIKKRFSTLYRRTQIEKYNAIEYHADVFSSSARHAMSDESLETHETGEALLVRRQELERDREVIVDSMQVRVYQDLLKGLNIEEMMSRHALPRVKVVGLINAITTRIKERRENAGKGFL